MASSLCCSNPPNLSASSGEGTVVDYIGGIKSYIVGSLDSKRAIILISDVYGAKVEKDMHIQKRLLRAVGQSASQVHGGQFAAGFMDGSIRIFDICSSPNVPICTEKPHIQRVKRIVGIGFHLRKIADKVAASGYFVVVPDFIHGDPFKLDDSARPFPVCLQSHTTEKGFEEAKPVIATLKEKGVSSVGAAGYCWGAKVVTELAKAAEIQAAVLLHPSLVSVDDTKEVNCPIAILGAETDHFSPPELVKQYEEALAAKSEIDYFVKIFPGVAHGWAVRYKADDASAVKSADEARTDMLEWFNKHLC